MQNVHAEAVATLNLEVECFVGFKDETGSGVPTHAGDPRLIAVFPFWVSQASPSYRS